jgi:beta-lactamase class D
MANKLDNLKKGNGFDKYPERINRKGRPIKLASKLNEIGYSNSQVLDTIKNILALTESEAEEIAENEDFTILERMIAKALLKDLSKNSLYNSELLISRAFGKPKESASIQTNEKIEFVYVKGKTIL